MAPKFFRVFVICTFAWTWSTEAQDAKPELLTNRTGNLNETFNALQDANNAAISSQTITTSSLQADFNPTSTSDRTSKINASTNVEDSIKSENLTNSNSTGTTQEYTSMAPTLEGKISGIPEKATNSILTNGTIPNSLSEVHTSPTQSYSISGQTSSSADGINPSFFTSKSSLLTPPLDTTAATGLGVSTLSHTATSSTPIPPPPSSSISDSPSPGTSSPSSSNAPSLISPPSTSPTTHFFLSSNASSSLSSFASTSSSSVLLPSSPSITPTPTASNTTSFLSSLISLTSTPTTPSLSSFRSSSSSKVPSSPSSIAFTSSSPTSTVPIPLTHSSRDDARTLENTVNHNNELRTTTFTTRTSIGSLVTSTALVSGNEIHTSSPPSQISTTENDTGESTSSSSEEEEVQVESSLIVNVKDDENFQDSIG